MDELRIGLALGVALLFVKEAGLPIPIPGDLVVLGLGAATAQGRGDPLLVAALVIAATIAGGAIQFAILGGPGRRMLVAISRRVGVGEERIEGQAARLRGGGAKAVAVARMTPGLRIVAIAAAAFAALPFARFLAGLAVGNGVFVGGHFVAGFALGPAAGGIVSAFGLGALLVAVALLGAVAWRVIARRAASARGPTPTQGDGAGDWSDASCPACIALGVVVAAIDRPTAPLAAP